MNTIKTPKTFLEAVTYFSNEVTCVEFLSNLKWSDVGEKCCTKCGSTAIYGLRTRPVFKCRDCKKQFSMKKGTIMEKSPLPITKWLPTIWMIINDKNGISSYEVARGLGVSQPTAWFMLHRIREAVQNSSFKKLSGEVEIDETYIGGKGKFMKKDRKELFMKNRRVTGDKTVVMGMVERGGEIRAKVVENARRNTLLPEIRNNVEEGSKVYTDKLRSYDTLSEYFIHEAVDHAVTYVDGSAHTNTLENFWGLFKRSIKGTYVHIAPFHTDRYLDEQILRYNNRKDTDSGRFVKAASQIFGKRLTYAELTGKLQ